MLAAPGEEGEEVRGEGVKEGPSFTPHPLTLLPHFQQDTGVAALVVVVAVGGFEFGVVGVPQLLPQGGEQTAAREVREETGVTAVVREPLGDVNYWYRRSGRRIYKTVHFYLFDYVSGSTADHDHEVDYAVLHHAVVRLHERTRGIVRRHHDHHSLVAEHRRHRPPDVVRPRLPCLSPASLMGPPLRQVDGAHLTG